MKKLEITPSRNVNYRRGHVNEGDRYVGVRSEDQMELANHLLKNVRFKKSFLKLIFQILE